MKLDAGKLPKRVEQDIEDFIADNNIRPSVEMTMEEALDYYLKWNGIIGYTETILEIVKCVK